MQKEWDIKTAHLTPGAGIMVVRKFDNEWKVLGLLKDSKYDITKGHVEPGDGYFETALRETFEEADIKNLNFTFGYDYCVLDYLRIYIATTQDSPKIKPNIRGVEEHEACVWLTFEEMEEQAYYYLKPAVRWARQKIKGGNRYD
jgi:8-oxo-dGTP pyrophosphatase MutT (NUDIX family)